MFDTLTAPLKQFVLEQRTRRTANEYTRVRPAEIPATVPAGTLKVLWVLAGNEWLGSSRLKGTVLDGHYRAHPETEIFSRIAYMPSQGEYLDPVLTWRHETWRRILRRGIDVLSFQTRNGATEALLEDCRELGIRTVFSISDLVLDQIPPRILQLSDAVVVSSDFLAEQVRQRHPRVVAINDPIDVPGNCRRQSAESGAAPELIWLGHPDHWHMLGFLREVLACDELSSIRLRTISRHPEATHQWTPQTVWEDARHSDIAVIPCDLSDRGKSKSSNRLVSFMAMGYPVVATPIPSYVGLMRQGIEGFYATTLEEWRECLRRLLDPELRRTMGEAAAKSAALEALRLPTVAGQWGQLFRELASG